MIAFFFYVVFSASNRELSNAARFTIRVSVGSLVNFIANVPRLWWIDHEKGSTLDTSISQYTYRKDTSLLEFRIQLSTARRQMAGQKKAHDERLQLSFQNNATAIFALDQMILDGPLEYDLIIMSITRQCGRSW